MFKQLFTFTFTLCTVLLVLVQGIAQPIYLVNPSFEGEPKASTTPVGWQDCGMPGQSPPDTHPANAFNVQVNSQEGRTYLGLVARDDDTWEAVGQKLRTPLEAGQCYKMNMYLARSKTYFSMSMAVSREVEFNEPIVLRVWGGNDYCENQELLAESEEVAHQDWRKYEFEFTPSKNFRYFKLEAFYKVPVLLPYRGNILVDNCSPITPCEMEMEEPIASNENYNKPPGKPKTSAVITQPPTTTKKPTEPIAKAEPEQTPEVLPPPVPEVEKPEEPKIMAELERESIKEGQKIEVKELYFKADTFVLNMDSYPVLDEIYNFLEENDDIQIEIGGHTNDIPPDAYCDKLSTSRAKEVANYLIKKGISKERISAKGYGKREPIASNRTVSGRKKNQRVEVKIISIGGDEGRNN